MSAACEPPARGQKNAERIVSGRNTVGVAALLLDLQEVRRYFALFARQQSLDERVAGTSACPLVFTLAMRLVVVIEMTEVWSSSAQVRLMAKSRMSRRPPHRGIA